MEYCKRNFHGNFTFKFDNFHSVYQTCSALQIFKSPSFKNYARNIDLCVSYFCEFFQNSSRNVSSFSKISLTHWFHKIRNCIFSYSKVCLGMFWLDFRSAKVSHRGTKGILLLSHTFVCLPFPCMEGIVLICNIDLFCVIAIFNGHRWCVQ